MKKLVIPRSACQRELRARPASSRAARSARSASGRPAPASTSRYIGVPWEISTPKTSFARVRMRVEVDEPDRAVPRRAGADVRLGDRVVAAEHDRDRAGREHLADRRLDRRVRPRRVGGEHRRVAEVDHRAAPRMRRSSPRDAAPGGQLAARIARGPNRVPGPVGDEIVRRRADDRDVHPLELGRILGVRHAAECEQAREVGLLAVLAPALERIDHGAILPLAWAISSSRRSISVSSAPAARWLPPTASRNASRSSS